MKKKLLGVSLALMMGSQMSFAAGGALIKFIGDGTTLSGKLSGSITNRSAVIDNFELATQNIAKRKGRFSVDDLTKLKSRITDSSDMDMYDKLMKILNKDIDDISAQEIVKASNRLALLSHRYGYRKVGTLECAAKCNEGSYKSDNIVFALTKPKLKSQAYGYKIISRKKTPGDMISYVNEQMADQNLGRFTNIDKEDEASLGFFVTIPKHRDNKMKDLAGLYDSITAISKAGGKNDFAEHKLWKLPSLVSDKDEANLLAVFFNRIAILKQNHKEYKSLNTSEALDKYISDIIDNESSLARKSQLKNLQAKLTKQGCFK